MNTGLFELSVDGQLLLLGLAGDSSDGKTLLVAAWGTRVMASAGVPSSMTTSSETRMVTDPGPRHRRISRASSAESTASRAAGPA